MEWFLAILAILLLIGGLAGTIHPAIPGLPLMFAGSWLLAYVGNYHYIGTTSLIIIGVITAIGMLMDFIAGLLGAKMTGASKKALWGSIIGAIVGIFFGIPGIILGPLIGAAVGEYYEKRDLLKAGKVGMGTFIGFIIGTVAKIGCALMIVFILIFGHLYTTFTS